MDGETKLVLASLVFSVLSFLMMVLGLAAIFYPGLRQSLQGISSTGSGFLDSLKTAGVLGGAISPDIVLIIGFISDLMNLKFRYSVTSLIGLSAVVLHWGVGKLMGYSSPASVTSTTAVSTAAAASGAATAIAATATATPVSAAVSAAPPRSVLSQIFGTGNPTAVSPSPAAAPVIRRRAPAPAAPAAAAAPAPAPAAAPAPAGAPQGFSFSFNPGSVAPPPSELNLGTPAIRGSRADRATLAEGSTVARSVRGPTGVRKSRTVKGGGEEQTGGATIPAYITQKFNPCAIRGLGFFDLQGSPMGLAALSAVFMVYLLDMTVGNKRSGGQIGGYLGFSAAVFALNVFAYREFKCVPTDTLGASMKALALPLIVGSAAGAGGYFVLKNNFANFLPLDGEKFDDGSAGGGGGGGNSGSQSHCSAPNSDDQMVCDLYKDGKRVISGVTS